MFNRFNRSQDGLIIDVVTQCYQQILPINSKGLSEYKNAPGLTSWPDRWILFRSAWQIRLQYPEQPHQSRPSRHHLLVPWATSPHLVLQCLSQSEKNSTKKRGRKRLSDVLCYRNDCVLFAFKHTVNILYMIYVLAKFSQHYSRQGCINLMQTPVKIVQYNCNLKSVLIYFKMSFIPVMQR